MFYHLWKFADAAGDAQTVYEDCHRRLEAPPADQYLRDYPYVHNAYIAGYLGFLELEKLAGYPESAGVRAELDRLLQLRVTGFSKDTPFWDLSCIDNALSISRNFMFLVPELGDYLREHAHEEVLEALEEYGTVAPYWFVSGFEETCGENGVQHFFDYHALFQAGALILDAGPQDLMKHLDVPATAIGDLFYIHNLVSILEASPGGLGKRARPTSGTFGTPIEYTVTFSGVGDSLTLTDTLPIGVSAPSGFVLEGTSAAPVYDGRKHLLIWQDSPTFGEAVSIRYTVTITETEPQALDNVAELRGPDGSLDRSTARVIANPHRDYLPWVLRFYQSHAELSSQLYGGAQTTLAQSLPLDPGTLHVWQGGQETAIHSLSAGKRRRETSSQCGNGQASSICNG
jgi:hypothetical protein